MLLEDDDPEEEDAEVQEVDATFDELEVVGLPEELAEDGHTILTSLMDDAALSGHHALGFKANKLQGE